MEYKGKDRQQYVLNMPLRGALPRGDEVHPTSDKISDVAYQLAKSRGAVQTVRPGGLLLRTFFQ